MFAPRVSQIGLAARSTGLAPQRPAGVRHKMRPAEPRADIGNQAMLRGLGRGPGLTIGAAHDPLEDTADRAASQAMNRPVSTKPAGVPEAAGMAPPVVHDTLRATGSPLDAATRKAMEGRFGRGFGDVRIHADAQADTAARSVGALAFTHGRDIVFRAGRYAPQTSEGGTLLAHELAHVAQHGAARAAGAIWRVPVPPGTAGYDRAKMDIGAVADFVPAQAGAALTYTAQTASIAVSDPAVTAISWELYDPADQMQPGSFSNLPSAPDAKTKPFVVNINALPSVTEGRYTLRCIGRDANHQPVLYADRSFFVWKHVPESAQDLAALNAVQAAAGTHSLGELGAAEARGMMLEHQASLAAGGPGTVQGNQCVSPTPGISQQDCTTYVLKVLGDAFTAKNKDADWKKVMSTAKKGSGGALKGTEVLKALESVAGWQGVFWSPDPRNPADANPEHPAAYAKVNKTGKYYGVDVDNTDSVVDYRPTADSKPNTWTNLDKLKKVPLGVIAAKGGRHMTLILNGQVYEVHWDKPASDPNVIEATPLENWAWNSGVIVMPPEDFANAF